MDISIVVPLFNEDESLRELFNWIKQYVEFDQLIWEHNKQGTYWIHVSYNLDGNRKQAFELTKR